MGTEPSPPDGGLNSLGALLEEEWVSSCSDVAAPSLLSERVVLTGRATPTMLKAGKIVGNLSVRHNGTARRDFIEALRGVHSLMIHVEPRQSLEELLSG